MRIMPEVAAIASLQIDVTGFPEANLRAHGHTEVTMKNQLNMYMGSSRIYNAAAQSLGPTNSEYQPGGALLAVIDQFMGRVIKHSCDKQQMGQILMGLHVWQLMRRHHNYQCIQSMPKTWYKIRPQYCIHQTS